jgi:dihydroorotate dehydrogenase (fumarate)
MVTIRRLVVSPPLINSSSLSASEPNQLQELFDSPHTGAVTTRTATLTGFSETFEHTVCLLCLCLFRRLTHLGGRFHK